MWYLAAVTVIVGYYSCRLGQCSAASVRAPCEVSVRGLHLIVWAVVVRPRLRMALSAPVTPQGNLALATRQRRRTSIRSPRSLPLTSPIMNQTCRLIEACPNPTRRRSLIPLCRSPIHLRWIHRLRVVLGLGNLERLCVVLILGNLELLRVVVLGLGCPVANVRSRDGHHPIQRMTTFRHT